MAFPTITASAATGPSDWGATELAITKPACNVGDTMVVVAMARNFAVAEMALTLSGFTLRQVGYVNPSLPHLAMNLYEREIDGSEGSTFLFECTNAAYLYGFAFTIPAGQYELSNTTGSGGGFDGAHQLVYVDSTALDDPLNLGILLGWSDPLTAGPSGWTTVFNAIDGRAYAWTLQGNMPTHAPCTPSDTDRWISITAVYTSTAPSITGTIAVTDATDTFAGSATETINGTIATIDADDPMAATGTASTPIPDVTGVLAIVDDDDQLYIGANRFGGGPTPIQPHGPQFRSSRMRRRYYDPAQNPITGP